jgi:phosphopantetheine adenylyltransferase
MAQEILGDIKNVEIVGFNSLLMDFVHERAPKSLCVACALFPTLNTNFRWPE